MATNTLPRLDTDAIRRDVDIAAWIGRDVELSEGNGYYFGPCPFCKEGDDRFKVWPKTRLFNCRHCGKKGDVIEYQMLKYGYDFVAAAKSLLADDVPQADEGGKLASRPGLRGDELAEYRRRLGEMTERAARCLVGLETPEAAAAWLWLVGRGVKHEQIVRYGIGYNTQWRQVIDDHKMPPGVTLPRYNAAGDVVAVNVYLDRAARELTGCRRMFVKGSDAKTFFGDLHEEAEIVFITEGELDCAVLGSFYPPHAYLAAVTTGGADTIPDDLGQLVGRRVVLLFDNDEAGRRGAARWQERIPGAYVATVPEGKDITDYALRVSTSAFVSWIDDILREVEGKA